MAKIGELLVSDRSWQTAWIKRKRDANPKEWHARVEGISNLPLSKEARLEIARRLMVARIKDIEDGEEAVRNSFIDRRVGSEEVALRGEFMDEVMLDKHKRVLGAQLAAEMFFSAEEEIHAVFNAHGGKPPREAVDALRFSFKARVQQAVAGRVLLGAYGVGGEGGVNFNSANLSSAGASNEVKEQKKEEGQ